MVDEMVDRLLDILADKLTERLSAGHKELYTAKELAERYGVSCATIRNKMAAGEFGELVSVGERTRLVPWAGVQAYESTHTGIRYNEVGGFFTVDLSIASTGEVLVYGDIVRYGRPLFNSVEDERFPVPVIMPLCLTGDDISEVTFENFGKEVRLYLWERNAA